MLDTHIRTELHRVLQAEHAAEPDTLILDELGLCQGNVRVDIAVVNGALTGYEIKSDRDTLARLPAQAAAYSRVLDSVTVVTGTRYLEATAKIIPEWWGLYEAVGGNDTVGILQHRAPQDNPGVDPQAVVQLLWRNEALEALCDLGLEKGMLSKPRHALWSTLVKTLTADELRCLVRTTIKARVNWRSV